MGLGLPITVVVGFAVGDLKDRVAVLLDRRVGLLVYTLSNRWSGGVVNFPGREVGEKGRWSMYSVSSGFSLIPAGPPNPGPMDPGTVMLPTNGKNKND